MSAKKSLHLFSFLVLTVTFFTFIPNSTFAQSIITAIPPRIELAGDPGEVITTQIKVRNDSENSEIYSIYVDDFIVIDTIGTPIPVSSSLSSRWSLKSWISAPLTVPVDAKGIQVVNLTIRVPMSALPGGHYAMVTFMPNADQKPGELKKTGSLIGQRVGSLVYLTVNGAVTENATVLKFAAPKFLEQGPVNFTGTIQNLSDLHINAIGKIIIKNPLNSIVTVLPLETGNIFPEKIRDFATSWDQKWGWGRYRADLSLAYGSTGGVLAATIFFWLFPIRLVIYVLIAIISILFIIILLNKRSKRHQELLEKEVSELKRELENLEQPKL